MKKIVILYSSGLDSRILYLKALHEHPNSEIKLLYWDHGHNAAKSEIHRLPSNAHVRKVEWLDKVNGLYEKKGDPSGPIYIPGRNLVFAVLTACQELPDEIWLGGLHEENHPGATDKNDEFIRLTEQVVNYVLSPFKDNIKIRIPLAEAKLTKYKATKWALANGASSFALMATISCYQQESSDATKPCGNCKQCMRRYLIFKDLGFEEKYEEHPIESKKIRDWVDRAIAMGYEMIGHLQL